MISPFPPQIFMTTKPSTDNPKSGAPASSADIYPIHADTLGRAEREKKLHQRATVIWLYGLSGSGKSTLANALERKLSGEGYTTMLLDGDNVRGGLNRGLGFTD